MKYAERQDALVSERRLLVLLALLLGLLAAVLLLLRLHLPGQNEPFLDWLGGLTVTTILGLTAIVGSLILYGGKDRAGGIINLVVGLVVLFEASQLAGVLLVFSGILGLVASSTPGGRAR